MRGAMRGAWAQTTGPLWAMAAMGSQYGPVKQEPSGKRRV